MESNLFLALRTTLRNKRIIILILLISTILLFGTIISTYQKSVLEHISSYSTSNYESLMYTVGKRGNKYEDTVNELKKIEHIAFMSREYDLGVFSLRNKEWKSKYIDGLIWINIANNNTLPILTKGQNFVDDKENYLICPEILYPNSTINNSKESKRIPNKSGINMEKYLNKTILFEEEVLNEENEIAISTIEAKIIGLYKVNKYEINDNICYGNINLRKETYNKYYENADKESIDYNPNPDAALIIIDNYNNYDNVMDKLNELGYHIEAYSEFDQDTVETLKRNSNIFSFIIIIICLLLVSIFLLINTISQKEEYKMYRYLGYTNGNIFTLNITSNIIMMIASLIISLILSFIYIIVIKLIISFYPFFFSKMEVLLSLKYLFIIFGVSVLWSFINSIVDSLFIIKN